jgi:sphingolipid delta-4 desaturase
MVYEPWALLNLAAGLAAAVLVVLYWGWLSLAYLVLSLVFAVGLHPLGARWIQEHYVFKDNQETYSYYGPLNRLALNVGHHNEHHDFMAVPWNRLPKVRATAPEYYNTLHYHRSWTKLWLKFLFDPSVTLYDRVVRADHDDERQGLTSRDTQRIQDDAVPEGGAE